MNLIKNTKSFKRSAKHLLKKYRSLADELEQLRNELLENPHLGIHLGDNIYKIRVASASKGKGKSGGFRVITYLVEPTETDVLIMLITIYDKSEQEDISKEVLLEVIAEIIEEENEDEET